MEHFFFDFKYTYVVIFLGQIIFIGALIQMAYQHRSPTSMIAWLLAFFLMPYITVPFYFFVGLRKHRYSKAQLFIQNEPSSTDPYTFSEVQEGNDVALYTTADTCYENLLLQINKAEDSIYMTVYKLDLDETTKVVLDSLQEKAKAGVKVKILLDALGSIKLYIFQYKLKEIRKAGVEIAFFMPIIKMPFRNYINLRNHRKALIFDEITVLSGGMNLTDTYFGPIKKKKRWQDIMFLIKGKASIAYLKTFIADWNYATGAEISYIERQIKDFGDSKVKVIPSGPDVKGDPFYETLLKKIYDAKKRIWIVTPYFTPDENIYQALIIAQHQGVDIRLITPKDSDHLIADLGRSSYMREIKERGIYVALHEGPMLHAKAILIDDIGILGSANVSYRSLFLNYEIISIFYSKGIVESIEIWMQKLLNSSTLELQKSGKFRRIGENLMKVFIPLL